MAEIHRPDVTDSFKRTINTILLIAVLCLPIRASRHQPQAAPAATAIISLIRLACATVIIYCAHRLGLFPGG
jgi:hypothetical protein